MSAYTILYIGRRVEGCFATAARILTPSFTTLCASSDATLMTCHALANAAGHFEPETGNDDSKSSKDAGKETENGPSKEYKRETAVLDAHCALYNCLKVRCAYAYSFVVWSPCGVVMTVIWALQQKLTLPAPYLCEIIKPERRERAECRSAVLCSEWHIPHRYIATPAAPCACSHHCC